VAQQSFVPEVSDLDAARRDARRCQAEGSEGPGRRQGHDAWTVVDGLAALDRALVPGAVAARRAALVEAGFDAAQSWLDVTRRLCERLVAREVVPVPRVVSLHPAGSARAGGVRTTGARPPAHRETT
jgi:hypothetical protein